ncbi:E3 ubiquitin-protein ligase ipaH3 [Candida viswanathii]|uniref:E3 ubiquitin-protein ligase ipaH3 n=1 Tax=Candida viswanathii TaxID=5486 RepID=A0A367YRH8_9ASCO|nr:E3 ubiquitin-protein ligase ipaH3 [Candida viswanathii]
MAHFHDLPDEVIDIILSQVPNDVLKKLFSVPILGSFAKRAVYSTVVINFPKVPDSRYPLYDEDTKFVSNSSQYVKLLQSDPDIAPKRIIFENPFDAIVLARTCPSALANVSTKLRFRREHFRTPASSAFAHEYLKAPFRVHSVETPYGFDFDDYLCLLLTRNVRALSVLGKKASDLKSISSVFFSRLSSLEIAAPLDAEDFRLLPKYLKKFVCLMKRTVAREMKLDLPESLEELNIDIEGADENMRCNFDISHLANLKHLQVLPYDRLSWRQRGLLGSWQVPRNLRKLAVWWARMIDGELASTCTRLIELKIEEVYDRDTQDYRQELSIPNSVRYLCIPHSFISYVKEDATLKFLKANPTIRTRVRMPDGLKGLEIHGSVDTRRAIVLDFHLNKLPQLEYLVVRSQANLITLGVIPKSLTRLEIAGHRYWTYWTEPVRCIDFKKLQFLDNLTELMLCGINKTFHFKCKLPDSLRKLVSRECVFRTIHIEAASLKYLDLSRNELANINNDRFEIPASVQELNLSSNTMHTMDVLLPDSLQKLDLSNNRLAYIPNLPDSLEVLNCHGNQLGKRDRVPIFPKALKWLRLSANTDFTFSFIEKLNLSQCTQLTNLILWQTSMDRLNLSCLPRSLVTLNLSSCGISYLMGIFAHFQRLEEVNLSHNSLNGYFAHGMGVFGIVFASKIKVVQVVGCKLSVCDVQALQYDLSLKRNFEHLLVERDLLAATFPTGLETRPRKMQKIKC